MPCIIKLLSTNLPAVHFAGSESIVKQKFIIQYLNEFAYDTIRHYYEFNRGMTERETCSVDANEHTHLM